MNKIILITGATSGIGRFLKEAYQKKGDTVINLSKDAPNEEHCYNVDLLNMQAIEKTMAEIKTKYKKIDVLINCAGYGISGATELIDIDEARKIFEVNAIAPLKLIQECLPVMARGSKIINISSISALFPLPFRTLYCASKSAILMISDSMKIELKKSGVDVTAICPGEIKTPFNSNRLKVYQTNERYGDAPKNTIESINNRQDGRMDLDYACGKIFKICEKKKFKPMYIIGRKYKFLYIGKKIFTTNFLHKVLGKVFYKD